MCLTPIFCPLGDTFLTSPAVWALGVSMQASVRLLTLLPTLMCVCPPPPAALRAPGAKGLAHIILSKLWWRSERQATSLYLLTGFL